MHPFIAEFDQADSIIRRGAGEYYSLGLHFLKSLHSWTGSFITYFGIINMDYRDNRQQIDRQN